MRICAVYGFLWVVKALTCHGWWRIVVWILRHDDFGVQFIVSEHQGVLVVL
jgi:hypothetical protein